MCTPEKNLRSNSKKIFWQLKLSLKSLRWKHACGLSCRNIFFDYDLTYPNMNPLHNTVCIYLHMYIVFTNSLWSHLHVCMCVYTHTHINTHRNIFIYANRMWKWLIWAYSAWGLFSHIHLNIIGPYTLLHIETKCVYLPSVICVGTEYLAVIHFFSDTVLCLLGSVRGVAQGYKKLLSQCYKISCNCDMLSFCSCNFLFFFFSACILLNIWRVVCRETIITKSDDYISGSFVLKKKKVELHTTWNEMILRCCLN